MTEMLERMCVQKPSNAQRSCDGEYLKKLMDIGVPGSDVRTSRDSLQPMSGDGRAAVRRERARKRGRTEFVLQLAEYGATRKPECSYWRSPAYAMRVCEAVKAGDNFSKMRNMSSNA